MPTPLMQRLRRLSPSREQLESHPWLRKLAPYLADTKVWHWSRRGVASGLAIGVFIGLLIPVAQIILAAVTAIGLRANIPVAALGTFISNPLTVPPIYYAAYHLGSWVTGTSASADFSLANPLSIWENLGTIALPLFTGLAITATCAASISYLLVSQLWIWSVSAKRSAAKS